MTCVEHELMMRHLPCTQLILQLQEARGSGGIDAMCRHGSRGQRPSIAEPEKIVIAPEKKTCSQPLLLIGFSSGTIKNLPRLE